MNCSSSQPRQGPLSQGHTIPLRSKQCFFSRQSLSSTCFTCCSRMYSHDLTNCSPSSLCPYNELGFILVSCSKTVFDWETPKDPIIIVLYPSLLWLYTNAASKWWFGECMLFSSSNKEIEVLKAMVKLSWKNLYTSLFEDIFLQSKKLVVVVLCVLCVRSCVHLHVETISQPKVACGGQQSTSGVFFNCSYFLRQGHSLNLTL